MRGRVAVLVFPDNSVPSRGRVKMPYPARMPAIFRMSVQANQPRALRHVLWTGRPRHLRGARFLKKLAKALCLVIFFVLVAGTTLYIRMTDPKRVRALAEGFFARVVDADVKIGDAHLSLFEGLQLDNVTIARRGSGEHATAIAAKRLQVSYSPLALVTGRLESGRIVAIEPEIHLIEDVDHGTWNLEALRRAPATSHPTTTPTTSPSGPPPLPEVLIRGGRVYRAEIVNGQYRELQDIRLEGQLLPRSGAYHFNLQARTDGDAAGPSLQGDFSLGETVAKSSLTHVDLAFLEPMLPARVRDFWRKLSPSGRVNVPVISFTRGHDDRGGFRIELELDDVKMSIHPTDWASAAERAMLSQPATVNAALARMPNTTLAQVGVIMQPLLRVGEVPLEKVNGRFAFTDDGVSLDELSATLDGNPFVIRGRLGGYAFDAPLDLRVESPADRPIQLRSHIPYMNALPAEIREVYYRFAPEGASRLSVALSRPERGATVKATGSIEFANSEFTFQQFKYPVKNASGRLVVDADPRTGELRLLIQDIKGTGPIDGPNAKGELAVSGWIAPLIGYASVDVTVTGRDIHIEPALMAALPPEARQVISAFDDDGEGPRPIFRGDFACHVRREPGAISRWSYDTDVNVRDAAGALKEFPFPLEGLAVDLRIRKDYVQIVSARSTHAGGIIDISGLTEWGRRVSGGLPRKVGEAGVRTQLTLKARDLPVDDALLNALPADARGVLQRLGIGGIIDVTGPITVTDPHAPPQFDLTIAARAACFAPAEWKTAVDALDATMQLTPHALKLDHAEGRRGDAIVTASGSADWSTPKPTIDVITDVTNLTLDDQIRDSLPSPAKSVWNSLRPGGIVDAKLALKGEADNPEWKLNVKPMTATLLADFLPIAFSNIQGEINAAANRVELSNLTGSGAGGTVTVNGVGEIGDRQSWALKLKTADTLVDRPLLDALPKALGAVLIDNEVAGRTDLEFDKLDWTTSSDGKHTDVAFDSAITLRDASWRTGVAFDKASGTAVLRGRFLDGDPAELGGDATLTRFRLAGVDARDGFAAIRTDAEHKTISLADIRAKIGSRGEVAGGVTLDQSRQDENRWAAEFLLRNADVAALTAGAPTKMTGELNASLSLEGAWASPDASPSARAAASMLRRGRGEISVSGKGMVNVPMILGVTQVVSLALPFTGGFDEATASYSLEGDRVSFSDISLQSQEMRIKGAGWLDFDRKQLSIDFVTDSTGKDLPVIGSFLDAARRELFQIKIRGSLSEPQVKAGSLRTITTTVDEILRTEKK